MSEYHVTRTLARALGELDLALTSYSLAPCWADEQPYYGLLVERGDVADAGAARRLTERLDALLKEGNIESAAKRDSLRLTVSAGNATHRAAQNALAWFLALCEIPPVACGAVGSRRAAT